MANSLVRTGPPNSIAAHLGFMRMQRTLPLGDTPRVELLQRLIRTHDYYKNGNEIRRIIGLLRLEGQTETLRIVGKAIADPKDGERILWAIYSHGEISKEDVALLDGLYELDHAISEEKLLCAFIPVAEQRPNIFSWICADNSKLAASLFYQVAQKSNKPGHIWYKLLAFCFRPASFGDPTPKEKEKTGITLLCDLYERDHKMICDLFALIAAWGFGSKYCSYEFYDLFIEVVQHLPAQIGAGIIYHVIQTEPKAMEKIVRRNNMFPENNLVQQLDLIDRKAAVFLLRAVFDRCDIVKLSYSLMPFGDPPKAGLSPDEIRRALEWGSFLSFTSQSGFCVKTAIEHARNIEDVCRNNKDLLKKFIASLDPQDINTSLLVYGLYIWDALPIIRGLGCEINLEMWKDISALRLVSDNTRRESYGLRTYWEDRERVIERFLGDRNKTKEEVGLFVDVMVRVASIEEDEHVAELFDKIAQKRPDLEETLQKLAIIIDNRKTNLVAMRGYMLF